MKINVREYEQAKQHFEPTMECLIYMGDVVRYITKEVHILQIQQKKTATMF